MDLGLGKKVVMITGASRGLGRAMAEALGAEGARLVLCARGAEALEQAAAELRTKGYEVDAEAVDIADGAAATRWVEGVAKRMGGVDVLVNNAGGARTGMLKDLDEAAWQAAFELLFLGGAPRAAVRAADGAARRRLDHQHQLDLWARSGRPADLQCFQGGDDLVHQDSRARTGVQGNPG